MRYRFVSRREGTEVYIEACIVSFCCNKSMLMKRSQLVAFNCATRESLPVLDAGCLDVMTSEHN